MQRHIFGIGSGRYEFDRQTLDSFIEESRSRCRGGGPPVPGIPGPDDKETQNIFEEIMALYHEYNRCQSIDLLVRLKCRLQEFSIRYQSHVLAEEVLNINSCLPYEQRIACR